MMPYIILLLVVLFVLAMIYLLAEKAHNADLRTDNKEWQRRCERTEIVMQNNIRKVEDLQRDKKELQARLKARTQQHLMLIDALSKLLDQPIDT